MLLSEHTRREIDHWVAKFPPGRQRSACIAALRAAQEQNEGHLTPDLMDAVAEHLKLPPIQVYEVATFYSMYELHPCGRHHVSICTNISCMLRGGEALVAHAEPATPRPNPKINSWLRSAFAIATTSVTRSVMVGRPMPLKNPRTA